MSMLPLKKITLLESGGTEAIFASACPEAFVDGACSIDMNINDQTMFILDHRQMCANMASGDVFVSPPQPLSHAKW